MNINYVVAENYSVLKVVFRPSALPELWRLASADATSVDTRTAREKPRLWRYVLTPRRIRGNLVGQAVPGSGGMMSAGTYPCTPKEAGPELWRYVLMPRRIRGHSGVKREVYFKGKQDGAKNPGSGGMFSRRGVSVETWRDGASSQALAACSHAGCNVCVYLECRP